MNDIFPGVGNCGPCGLNHASGLDRGGAFCSSDSAGVSIVNMQAGSRASIIPQRDPLPGELPDPIALVRFHDSGCAVRVCSACRRFLGVRVDPGWGPRVAVTHGLCDRCFAAALDAA